MFIETDQGPIEAFNLIMKKEWAKKILDGSKTVEFRAYSPFYIKMFTIPESFEENNRRLAEAERLNLPDPELIPDSSPISAIHFHPYGKSWHLDCLIDDIKLVGCDRGGAMELREDWGSHDLDDFMDVPDGNGPLTFALHISGIIGHHGL